ncbi:MAG: alpha-amylase, partial [Acidobacteriota bacterium]
MRTLADLAEHPRAAAAGGNRKVERERKRFLEHTWVQAEEFLRLAREAYIERAGGEKPAGRAAHPAGEAMQGEGFDRRLRAAMRLPFLEPLFPAPWTAAARRILPSPSPELHATALWGPILGWCVLQLLAESVDREDAPRVALDLFDRLRLREPFARAFTALGFEPEESWRGAARIKVLLLAGASVGKPGEKPTRSTIAPAAEPSGAVPNTIEPVIETPEKGSEPAPVEPLFWPELWLDPDVRWLTGVHRAESHEYLIRERFEELLWWLLLPSLL